MAAIRGLQPHCGIYPYRISQLETFVSVCNALARESHPWFRGHSNVAYRLVPSALRYSTERERTRALQSVYDFQRLALMKLDSPPGLEDLLQWTQLARHYGLPTRLLDWTMNAAVGLYFACSRFDEDGLVFALNPLDLNAQAKRGETRVFDGSRDAEVIRSYLRLSGRLVKGGSSPIAINPILNSERLILQKGTFTIAGAGTFDISTKHAPSLVAIPILREDKETLIRQLRLIGIDEMSLYPEPEHICAHLCELLKL